MPKEVTNSSPKARSARSPRKVPSTGSRAHSVNAQSKASESRERSVVASTVQRNSVAQMDNSQGTTGTSAGRPRDFAEDDDTDDSMEQRTLLPGRRKSDPGLDRCGDMDSDVNAEKEYEGDEALNHEHSEQEWVAFEERFSSTNFMVAFSIDEPTVAIPERGYWGLRELSSSIVKVCGSKGVQFEAPGLISIDRKLTILLGRPSTNNRELWKVLRRGYVKVLGAVIWVAPDFTGRKQSNLDLIELEYSNSNYLSASDLHVLVTEWGAMEALIVSHGSKASQGGKWPAIACVTNAVIDPLTNEPRFAFRLCFECEATANTVFQAYLDRVKTPSHRIAACNTIRLSPVRNIEWSTQRHSMIRPSSASELENLGKRLHIFGIQPEIGEASVKDRLGALGYKDVHATILPGRRCGTLVLQDEQAAVRLYETFGVNQVRRISIGNIKLFVNKPGDDEGLRCFRCGLSGHYSSQCYRTSERSTQHDQRNAHGLINGPTRGRANDRWQAVTARTRSDPESNRQYSRQILDNHRQHSGNYGIQVIAKNQVWNPQRTEASIRALITDQVREQSRELSLNIQTEMHRHTQEIDSRLNAHDSAIRTIQSAQESTTMEVKGIASLLERMARHLKVPDFCGGSLESGTDSQ